MNRKFFVLVIFVSFFCIGIANSQIIPTIQKVSLTKNDKEMLDKHISKYTVFTMDKKC